MKPPAISAIVPTIGRPKSVDHLLRSLVLQSYKLDEVIAADASNGSKVRRVCEDPQWAAAGLPVRRVVVRPPNAVRQRKEAIALARGSHLLLDDDVVLEQGCVEAMVDVIVQPGIVAMTADFSNQLWSGPTVLWRGYLRYVKGLDEGAWQGKVIGPLLRFGYRPSPVRPMPMEWLGAGNSLVRRDTYEEAGGFSDFFLHRCTMKNEDVDLGLKLNRIGRIVLSPAARMAHMQAPAGRVAAAVAAEDDLHNRYMILRHTAGRSAMSAFGSVLLFFVVETLSNVGGALRRRRAGGLVTRLSGRARALARIVMPSAMNTHGPA